MQYKKINYQKIKNRGLGLKWFKHETNCGYSAKMKKLLMKYGVQGYGLYYYCVEIIAGNLTTDNITFELEHDASILAHDLKMDTLLVEEIMKYCIKLGLFEYDDSTKKIIHLGLFKMLDNTMSQNFCIKQMKTSENFKLLKESSSSLKQKRIEEKRIEEKRIEEKRIEEKRIEEKEEKKSFPKKTKRFQKPTLSQITEYMQKYCKEKNLKMADPDQFFDYYESNNWMVGKNKMSSFEAAIRTWVRRHAEFSKNKTDNTLTFRQKDNRAFFDSIPEEMQDDVVNVLNGNKSKGKLTYENN